MSRYVVDTFCLGQSRHSSQKNEGNRKLNFCHEIVLNRNKKMSSSQLDLQVHEGTTS